jgi:hypothetical protein
MEDQESDSIYMHDESFMHMLHHFLRCHGREDLQLETCWILTNLAAGSSTQTQLVSEICQASLDFSNPNLITTDC